MEIGALHRPLPVGRGAKVRYVDRMDVEGLRSHYPELIGEPLVAVDIIDDGEQLGTLPDASQDFIIANHFLEHTENPIATLENHLRVLRPGGHMYLAIPLKDATFDVKRPITPLEHLLGDYRDGPAATREQHYEEWARLVEDVDPDDLQATVADLLARDYSIHFHVWDQAAFVAFIRHLESDLGLPFRLRRAQRNHHELIVILEKTAG